MFKVRNLAKKEDVNTEFWLEEEGGAILLKAKLSNQTLTELIIASIDKNGMLIWEGISKDLGFETTIYPEKLKSDLFCINVRYC